jgi:hypothetical protein
MTDGIHTAILNRHRKVFQLSNGVIVEFEAMLDGDCNITDDANTAVIAIYKTGGRYKGVDMRLFVDSDGNEPTAYPNCDDLDCAAVNLRGKFFRLDDGATIPFAAMLDGDCNIIDDANAAVIAIVRLPDGLYRGVDLRLFIEDHPDMLETLQ